MSADQCPGLASRAGLGRPATSTRRRPVSRALTTFVAIEARYVVARIHVLLAEVHHARGDKVVTHLRAARERFERLSVPRWVERVTKLADHLGVSIG